MFRSLTVKELPIGRFGVTSKLTVNQRVGPEVTYGTITDHSHRCEWIRLEADSGQELFVFKTPPPV